MKNMKTGNAARLGFRWSPERWFGVNYPWSPEAGDVITPAIKGLGCAAWDNQTKTWWLPEHFYFHCEALLKGYFGDLQVERLYGVRGGDQSAWLGPEIRHPSFQGETPYAVLGLLPEASDSVVRAAYRALCDELDPDKGGVGGSYEPIERVKAAYERIRAERGL